MSRISRTLAILVLISVVLLPLVSGCNDISILPTRSVVVTMASSSTKRDWINATIEQFNAQGHTTNSGKTIVVEATHVTSGGSRSDILDGKLQPVVWSPGDQS